MGAIKSIQRGVSVSAGDVTINSVNVIKTSVKSKSKGSAGYAAARGSMSLSPSGGAVASQISGGTGITWNGSFPTYSGSITGGTTDLTTKQFSAKLKDATTITVDGACEWQVIEYN